MRSVAKSGQSGRNSSPEHDALAARTVLSISGALISVLGLAMTIAGWRVPVDCTAFWVLCGTGLIISGFLLAKRKRAGAWAYLLVFAATVTWALRNVDEGASLPQRLVGPAVLLAMLAALMPPLSNWRPRYVAMAFATIMLATAGLGIASTANGPLARQTAKITRSLDNEAKGILR